MEIIKFILLKCYVCTIYTRFLNRAEVVSGVSSFPPFVAKNFSKKNFEKKFFLSNSKNSFKFEFLTLFYGGRVPKNRPNFSKKKIFFRRSRLPPPKFFFLSPRRQKKFRKIFFLSNSKNSSIFELPDPKIGGLGHIGSGRSPTFTPV